MIDLAVVARPRRVQGAAVGAELRRAVVVAVAGEALRLPAACAHLVQRRDYLRVRRLVPVGGGGEHDAGAVRRPGRGHPFAPAPELAPEAGHRGQSRAGQEVARRRAGLERLDEQTRRPVVEPAVPVLDREPVVDPRVPSPRAPHGSLGAVRRVGGGPAVDHACEQDRPAVGAPARFVRAGGEGRHPLRLSTLGEIEDVDLRSVVSLASGGKRDLPAVRAPRHATLTGPGVGEPPRLRAAVGRHDPQIAGRLALRVRGLGDGEDRPAAVRTHGRSADAFHQPDVLVGDGVPGRRLRAKRAGGQLGGERDGEDESERVHTVSWSVAGYQFTRVARARQRRAKRSALGPSGCGWPPRSN